MVKWKQKFYKEWQEYIIFVPAAAEVPEIINSDSEEENEVEKVRTSEPQTLRQRRNSADIVLHPYVTTRIRRPGK